MLEVCSLCWHEAIEMKHAESGMREEEVEERDRKKTENEKRKIRIQNMQTNHGQINTG